MPPNPEIAYVDHDSTSKPPTLYAGNISPMVMRSFKVACLGYFDNKEIPEDKCIRKILASFKDEHIIEWICTEQDRLLTLSFPDFMTEVCAGFLNNDWEEKTR
jgi:hypothetical protein